jgi:hypothetical protein
MQTMKPHAERAAATAVDLEVYAIIEGRKVYLPAEAKYVMQDCRGLWFYSTRKPRTSEGDWTANKTGIACRTPEGHIRTLRTDPALPWLKTSQKTRKLS